MPRPVSATGTPDVGIAIGGRLGTDSLERARLAAVAVPDVHRRAFRVPTGDQWPLRMAHQPLDGSPATDSLTRHRPSTSGPVVVHGCADDLVPMPAPPPTARAAPANLLALEFMEPVNPAGQSAPAAADHTCDDRG